MKLDRLLMVAVLGFGTVLATGAVGVRGSPRCGEPGEDTGSGSQGVLLYWNCPEPFKRSLRNVSPLNAGLNAFWRVERKLPRSAQEFLTSPYMFLFPEDLWNGYQDREVRFIDMSSAEKEALLRKGGEEADRVLGDIAFVRGRNRKGEEAAHFVVFVKGIANKEEVVVAHPGITLGGAPDGGAVRKHYEEDRAEGWYDGLSAGDKTVYAACHYLWNSLGVTTALVRFDERQSLGAALRQGHDPLRSRMRNPFHSRFMKEVSAPSPGDFLLFSGPPLGVQPVCFGSDGRVVKPIRAYYQKLLESEQTRLSAGLERDASLVFPPGM